MIIFIYSITSFTVIASFRGTVPYGLSLEIGDTVQILEKCDGKWARDDCLRLYNQPPHHWTAHNVYKFCPSVNLWGFSSGHRELVLTKLVFCILNVCLWKSIICCF